MAVLIIYLILNAIGFMAGFIWTGIESGLKPENRDIKVNLRKPGPYLLWGFTLGHYAIRGLLCLF